MVTRNRLITLYYLRGGKDSTQESTHLFLQAILKTECVSVSGGQQCPLEQVWLHKVAWLRGVLDVGVQILQLRGLLHSLHILIFKGAIA